MKKTQEKRGKWLHLGPLILGVYAAFLGFSLVLLGLEGMGEGKGLNAIGWIRFLCGFFMACLGLYGIWDGVGALIKSKKKPKEKPKSQYILTDIEGKKSSNVNEEVLGERDTSCQRPLLFTDACLGKGPMEGFKENRHSQSGEVLAEEDGK